MTEPEFYFVRDLGIGVVLAEDDRFYREDNGLPVYVGADMILVDEDGEAFVAGDEFDVPASIEDLQAEALEEQAEAARAAQDAQQAYLERQFDADVDNLIDQYEAAEQEEEAVLAKAQDEQDLRADFADERQQWERDHFSLTQDQAAPLWQHYERARRRDPNVSLDEIVPRVLHTPDLSRDPLARRQQVAEILAEEDEQAALREAMEEGPIESNARDAGERQHALAEALRSGLTKVEAENRIAATGDRHAYSMKKTGETDPEGEPLYEVVKDAA